MNWEKLRSKKSIIFNLRSKFIPKYIINYRNQGLINYIDVGSVGGLTEPWRSKANVVRFLLNFEPMESPMTGKNFMTYNTALWESDDILPFHIYKGFKATGSSLFEQNIEYVDKNFDELKRRGSEDLAKTWFDRSQLIETKKIKCRSLDNIIKDEFPTTPFHFMKIDAQGAEYNILKGSESLLCGSCVGLHLELFSLPLYKGIVLLNDVKDYLAEFGFRLAKKFPAHGSFDSQHDCLFLKDADPTILSIIFRIYDID